MTQAHTDTDTYMHSDKQWVAADRVHHAQREGSETLHNLEQLQGKGTGQTQYKHHHTDHKGCATKKEALQVAHHIRYKKTTQMFYPPPFPNLLRDTLCAWEACGVEK